MFNFTKKKPLLFYKYLLSYMIIFLIPFITISIIFYHMSITNLKEEITRSNIAKLEQVRDISDARMRELWNISTKISHDHRLTPYMLEQPYQSKLGISELTSYQINSSYIDSLFLIYHDSDLVYSPKGTGTIENIMDNIYPFKENEKNRFKRLLKDLDKSEVYPIPLETRDPYNLVSYIYPVPPHSSTPHGAVVFFVQDTTIKNLINNILGDFSGNAFIFDDNDQLIASKNVGESLLIDEIVIKESGVFNKKIKNEDYVFVTVQSAKTNWTFMTAMPTAQFYKKMSSMKITILVMLFIIAILGMIVTIYLSLKQYKPIQRLSQFLKHKNNGNEALKTIKVNEIERIKQTIEFIYENSEKLRKRIDIQKPFVKDQFLLKLLKDNFTLKQEIKTLLEEMQIKFIGNYFFVIVIAFNETISVESFEHREETLKLLSEVSYKDCNGFGTELFRENAVAMIISTQNESLSRRNEFSDALKDSLKNVFKTMPTLGVGKIYAGMDQINRSFIEAAATIEHNRFNEKKDLIYFEDIANNKRNPLWYPVEYHVQLTQSLKRGDQIVATEALTAIIKDLKKKNISTHMLKCMCFDVINSVLKIIFNLSLPINIDDMHKISKFTTLGDLEEKIKKLIVTVCNNVNKRIENHNNYLRDNILDYIQNNFSLHNLSLAIVAEKFELSLSYLSRFIKEQTGSTFTQYVWELRNKAFKKELIETDRPIKDIVSQIGYVDVANFTRKFKQVEGLTPGQYRKRYFNHDQEEEAL